MLNFVKSVQYFVEFTSSGNETKTTGCDTSIDAYALYQFSLIPAVLIMVALAATRKRRRLLLDVWEGRPGLLSPMDIMTRSTRLSFACAFGATAHQVYDIVWNQQYAIEYSGTPSLNALIIVLSVLIYGLVFFPLFACLALGTTFSYGLGSLYSWVFFSIDLYNLFKCDMPSGERAIFITMFLPVVLCDGYLSFSLPYRFVVAYRKQRYFTAEEDVTNKRDNLADIHESYHGQHVIALLRKPISKPPPPVGLSQKAKVTMVNVFKTWIYEWKAGFQYPARIMSVMFVGVLVIYLCSAQLLVSTTTMLNAAMSFFDNKINKELGGWDKIPGEPEENANARFILIQFYDWTHTLRTSVILAITLSALISLLSVLQMLKSYRENLYAMYRGDHRFIPPPNDNPAPKLLDGSIKYAGFQVAYMFWSFIIVAIILFIVNFGIAFIITLFMKDFADWIVDKIKVAWPGVVIGFVLVYGQSMLAKKCLLQGTGKYLQMDNRRSLFIFMYFMFFNNVFLGLVSCLLRIVKAIGVGTVFLARLDNSTLPRKFEFFDPGFSTYQGFIHLEAAHSHPVVIVFIRLLRSLSMQTRLSKLASGKDVKVKVDDVINTTVIDGGDVTTGTVQRKSNPVARFNWHVLYTLLHNPQIRLYRKGFFQAMNKAKNKGIKIPVSDKPVSDFDLVKLLQERDEKEAAENGDTNEKDEGSSSASPMSIGLKLRERLFNRNKEEKKEEEGVPHVYVNSMALDWGEAGSDTTTST